jgi:adenine-specific DNA-methyltransferase
MIKYLGSKRVLVPVLGTLATATGAHTALDLFTGTTRVAREFKARGLVVTAVDLASYAHVLAQCYVATDTTQVNGEELAAAMDVLTSLPGKAGYVTRTFCEEARFFQPHNGARIDAMRNAIEEQWGPRHPLYPVLLTALMEAADRVDSTTGLQMAYLKNWAARSAHDLELRAPKLLPGSGRALRGDALALVSADGGGLGHFDLAYVDPPYNQHRYFTNYHIWETLVRWDAPEHYGKACKRIDARGDARKSAYDSKHTMPAALRDTVLAIDADVMVVSFNNEAWVAAADIADWLRQAGHEEVIVLDFDFKRYVGAQIGIYNLDGVRVGTPGRTRNIEHLIVGGGREKIAAIQEALSLHTLGHTMRRQHR